VGVRPISHRGIDSSVGEFRGRNLRLSYDYGWYGGTLKDWPGRLEEVVIDGRRATIGFDAPLVQGMRLPKSYTLRTAVSIRDDPDPLTTLAVRAYCRTEEECAIARKMFMSIRFTNRSMRKHQYESL
jgi:hypothetical protein